MRTQRYVIILGQVCEYEDKAPFVPSGKSVHGAIEYDKSEDKLKCHECGGWFRAIGSHLLGERISPQEYKRKHGLLQKTALMVPSARVQRATATVQYLVAKAPGERLAKAGRARANVKQPGESSRQHERANLRGSCAAQLAKKVRKIADDLGLDRAPLAKEMIANGITYGDIYRMSSRRKGGTGDGVGRLKELAGFSAEDHSKYSKAILIETLRDFYAANGRLPSTRDLNSGLLPTHPTFKKYFGSFEIACREAGFAYVLKYRSGSGQHGSIKQLIQNAPELRSPSDRAQASM